MNEDHVIIGKILAKYPELSQDDQFILDEWLKDDGNRQIFELLTDRQEVIRNLQRYFEIKDQMNECKRKFNALAETTSPQKTPIIKWKYLKFS